MNRITIVRNTAEFPRSSWMAPEGKVEHIFQMFRRNDFRNTLKLALIPGAKFNRGLYQIHINSSNKILA